MVIELWMNFIHNWSHDRLPMDGALVGAAGSQNSRKGCPGQVRSGLVRSGQVRSGLVRSGQVRSG